MPLYDLEHVIPLSDEQMESLANSWSELHAKRFNTPKVFINVRFLDVSNQKVYRGGRLSSYNRAIPRTRAGDRSREVYGEHCKDVAKIWDDLMCQGEAVPLSSNRRMRAVWVLGALTTGVELGIQRPEVGNEDQWMIDHRAEFEKPASEGDEDMQELVDSLK